MQKHIHLLKLALPLLTLLIVGGIGFSGKLLVASAATDTCTVYAIDNAMGNIPLKPGSAVTNQNVITEAGQFHLQCSQTHTVCYLIPGDFNAGNAILNLSTIQTSSSYDI